MAVPETKQEAPNLAALSLALGLWGRADWIHRGHFGPLSLASKLRFPEARPPRAEKSLLTGCVHRLAPVAYRCRGLLVFACSINSRRIPSLDHP
jgi:hypothetical protein